MNEKTVTPWVRYSFERIGAWAYKIPDAPRYKGQQRMSPVARPFDLTICYEGQYHALELKFLRDYQAFGRRHLRESQVEHLDAVENAGGSSWVGAVVCVPRRFCRLILWPWREFPQRSMRKSALEGLRGVDRQSNEGGRYYWDLDQFTEEQK